MTKISTTVTSNVILGTAAYSTPLNITATGTIANATAGLAGITVPSALANARILNNGEIIGGEGGAHKGNAGNGVDSQSSLTLYNGGTIAAGKANASTNTAESGGIGVDLRAGGTFKNAGTVLGGDSGNSGLSPSADGGIGAELNDVAFSNSGTVAGGTGGFSHPGTFTAANGGIGVDMLDQSHGVNEGLITGGVAGYTRGPFGKSGAGVQLANSKLYNSGTIVGGAGGSRTGGEGGVGANLLAGAAFSNSGLVEGGFGGNTTSLGGEDHTYTFGTYGGAGIMVNGAIVTSSGTIIGGSATGTSASGGAGLVLVNGTVTNTGNITGGTGAYYANSSGNGVDLRGGLLVSTGTITGGSYQATFNNYNAGAGVDVQAGTLVAGGTIIGGNGYEDGTLPGSAVYGVGVYINGGTTVAEGTIVGGAQEAIVGPTTQRDAVAFGTLAGTLILHPTAVFEGQVAATAGAGDALELAGTAAGTLNGFGTQFTGFDTLTVEANARWSLTGTSALSLDLPVTDNGQLTLATAISGTGGIALGTGATLTANQSVTGIGVTFGGPGHLNLAAPATFAATITAFGSGDVIDLEHLHATTATFAAGTLTLQNGTSTVGSLAFAGTFTSNNFSLSSDAHGGTNITFLATHAAILPDFTALLTHSPLGHPTASPPDAHARFSTELAHADLLTIGHPSSHTT